MTRQATWNRIGTDITAASNIKEALDLSLLNYQVEKRPIYLANGVQVPNQFATVKAGSSTVLGIVGKDYEIVQNLVHLLLSMVSYPKAFSSLRLGKLTKATTSSLGCRSSIYWMTNSFLISSSRTPIMALLL